MCNSGAEVVGTGLFSLLVGLGWLLGLIPMRRLGLGRASVVFVILI